jgi:hypothetical protein
MRQAVVANALRVYPLDDGRVEIDQSLVENAIRPTAIEKKNWLFVGEAEAGHRSAILYTVVECCRRCGLDPSRTSVTSSRACRQPPTGRSTN